MSLSQDTVDVLKACHPLLKEGRSVVGDAFYKRLFHEHPQVVNLALIVMGKNCHISIQRKKRDYVGNIPKK